MGEIEGEFISINKLLDSHQESVGGGEGDVKVKCLQNVEFPLDNVLLSELWVSRCCSNDVFQGRRVNLFVFHSDQ